MKTNYEKLRDNKMKDPEFRVKYLFAKEKLDLELMLDSIKESVNQKKSPNTIIRRINKLSRHIHNINLV
ncbi:MAG: hypothetical protein HW421_507 [Ignavibacteria bacterium]|nr:hypothetical protein [Ignavibacteria bacterium]